MSEVRSDERSTRSPHDVVLNEEQRGSVSFYFSPENHEGEPWPLDEPVTIRVVNGELEIGGAWLHSDGEWATFPELQATKHLLDKEEGVDPESLAKQTGSRPAGERFYLAAMELESHRPMDLIDGPYLNVRVDSNVKMPLGSGEPRQYRILVRATDPPLFHDDLKDIIAIAEKYELEASSTAAGIVLTAQGNPPDDED